MENKDEELYWRFFGIGFKIFLSNCASEHHTTMEEGKKKHKITIFIFIF